MESEPQTPFIMVTRSASRKFLVHTTDKSATYYWSIQSIVPHLTREKWPSESTYCRREVSCLLATPFTLDAFPSVMDVF